MPALIRSVACAKINLYLHVLGRRPDGYHELDSLVAFASTHDLVELRAASGFSLHLKGPFGAVLAGEPVETNLVTRATLALAAELGRAPDVCITLTKNLPLASGIGGGSSDAAAALRGLALLWGLSPADPRLYRIAAGLGADVPVCLYASTAFFGGAGAEIEPGPILPDVYGVLVNPLVATPTARVFAARRGPFSGSGRFHDDPGDVAALIETLGQRRNDLTEAAMRTTPAVVEALAALEATEGCLLARMSGSGATCFGLYASVEDAAIARVLISRVRPHWWTSTMMLLNEAAAVETIGEDGGGTALV